MLEEMQKTLFISHDASRTGAPIVFLHLLRWLKENTDLSFDILLLRGGELESEFQALGKVYYWEGGKPIISLFQKNYYHLKRTTPQKEYREKLLKELMHEQYHLIYANTVVSVAVATQLKQLEIATKVIAHIHELQLVIESYTHSFQASITYIDHFITVSELVAQNLTKTWGISKEQQSIIYEFSKIPSYIEQTDVPEKNVFHVGASGVVHWRKGEDIFLQVAKYIKNNYPNLPIQFTWVGAFPNEYHRKILLSDVQKSGLNEVVQFVGSQSNPFNYYNKFDVFLLTSREDPFPLVCIEIGMLGKPIICFENATGTSEVLENGGGFVVPYLDIQAMAEKIIFYYQNAEIHKTDGEKSKENFSNFTPSLVCPKIFSVIEQVIDKK